MLNFTFASLFTGCGGADTGLRMAGGTHLWGIEREEKFGKIAQANGFNVIIADIKDVNISQLAKPDVLWLSPPCQSYSKAKFITSQPPDHKDHDAGLYCIKYIKKLKPKYLILENVPEYRKSEVYFAIRNELFRLGYFISEEVIKVEDLGVPQTRSRFIVRAVKVDRDFKIFKPLKIDSPHQSWDDIWANSPDKDSQKRRPMSQDTIRRLQDCHPDLFDQKPEVVMTSAIFEGQDIREVGQPSFTIVSKPHQLLHLKTLEMSNLPPIAAARIQTFPDDYKFPLKCVYTLFKTIGNAVPPLLAQRVVESMIY